jgi:hypothetical protein
MVLYLGMFRNTGSWFVDFLFAGVVGGLELLTLATLRPPN